MAPSTAPNGRPHPNDVGPFSSATYLVAHGSGSIGPHSVDVRMNDRDVLLIIGDDEHHVRVLHLQNVREDTLSEAKTAADTFLDQIEPLGGDDQPASTVFQMFDTVYEDMADQLGGAINLVEDLSIAMSEMDHDHLRYPKRTTNTTHGATGQVCDVEGFNPVAELMGVCFDFLRRAREIQEESESCRDESCPKRDAYIVTNLDNIMVHGEVVGYIGDQVQARGLAFDWFKTQYSGDTLRNQNCQLVYHVYFDEDEGYWQYMPQQRGMGL